MHSLTLWSISEFVGAFNNHTDIELWHLAAKGDNYEAFDELINRFWQPLFNSAFKRVASREVCEDLVQDVFLNIWLRRASLEIELPGPYLQSAIRFRIYSHYARNKFTREFVELFDEITDYAALADQKLRYNELRNLVSAWISTLPAKRQRIFKLYIEENLTTREIANELNITQKTVQNQLNRSFGSLKAKLSEAFSLFLFL